METGKAAQETLRKLSEVTAERLIDLYVVAGWLTEEEVKEVPVPEMTDHEIGVLQMWRGMTQEHRDALCVIVRGMHPFESRPEEE